jgi:hypothetical protein
MVVIPSVFKFSGGFTVTTVKVSVPVCMFTGSPAGAILTLPFWDFFSAKASTALTALSFWGSVGGAAVTSFVDGPVTVFGASGVGGGTVVSLLELPVSSELFEVQVAVTVTGFAGIVNVVVALFALANTIPSEEVHLLKV